MEIVSHSDVHTVDDFNTINMCVLALPLFVQDKAFGRKKGEQQLRHILNMKQINMRLCTSEGVKGVTHTIKNPSSVHTLDAKYTLVPFKYHHTNKKSQQYPLVISHDSMISTSSNMITEDGIHRVVRNEYAETLTEEEMTSFMKHLQQCSIEFDSKSPMEYLMTLAEKILEKEDFTVYKSSIGDNFYEAYQKLRTMYQKTYNYRLGICDGAHRITAMFNILHGISFESNELKTTTDLPDSQKLTKLKSIARCEIWKYDNLGK